MRWTKLTLAAVLGLAISSPVWADYHPVMKARGAALAPSSSVASQGSVQLTHYGYRSHYGGGCYDGPIVIRPPVPHHPTVVIPFPGHPPVAIPHWRGHSHYGYGYGGCDYYRYRSSGHGSVSIYGPRLGFSIGW